jgi:hypothetical protein
VGQGLLRSLSDSSAQGKARRALLRQTKQDLADLFGMDKPLGVIDADLANVFLARLETVESAARSRLVEVNKRILCVTGPELRDALAERSACQQKLAKVDAVRKAMGKPGPGFRWGD